jgi:3-oxoacyl-[acyl-carrier-protein] synthase-3
VRVATIQALENHLPDRRLTNADLAQIYPGWTADKILDKTGIRERRVAAADEYASDLAVAAVEKLIRKAGLDRTTIDLLIYCTQSPDYFLPTTACMLQDRLRLPTTAAALDYNLGCSAFPYGLALVRGLIETGTASKALLVLAETYSKFIHPLDKSVRTLFGDAASVTFISAADRPAPTLGPFVLGTDGAGATNLIVKRGAIREPGGGLLPEIVDGSGNIRTEANLYMNGPAILEFTMKRIPRLFGDLLERAAITLDDVRWVILHQANAYVLNYLQKKIGIPNEKFATHFSHCGNTVSSTIPIVLQHLVDNDRVDRGDLVLTVGFGVGYSWGANLIRWSPD